MFRKSFGHTSIAHFIKIFKSQNIKTTDSEIHLLVDGKLSDTKLTHYTVWSSKGPLMKGACTIKQREVTWLQYDISTCDFGL